MGPSALDRAVRSMVSDDYKEEDFDKIVAELILQEAREKNQGTRRISGGQQQQQT
jgi:hypothetical protein